MNTTDLNYLDRKIEELKEEKLSLQKKIEEIDSKIESIKITRKIFLDDIKRESSRSLVERYDSPKIFFDDLFKELHTNMSQFVEVTGLCDQAIYNWINGKNIPQERSIARLANCINQLESNYPTDQLMDLFHKFWNRVE